MDGHLMNEELYRQVIMEHYKYPNNKVSAVLEADYLSMPGVNPSCGDEVVIYAKIIDNILVDIKFSGSGCSICCASSSIMTEELKNKDLEMAVSQIEKFKEMVKNKKEPQAFEDAQALMGVSSFPARFKCAFLGWDTLNNIIKEKKNGKFQD